MLLLAWLLSAMPAGGADPEDLARDTFRDAKQLYDNKRHEAALEKFQKAWSISQSPNARLYVARCFRELGKLPAAYDEFLGTLRDASARADDESRYQATRNAAAAEMVFLEPKVSRLVIVVDRAAPEAKVTLDGKPVAKEQLGEPMTVMPGSFEVVAKNEKGKEVTQKVEVEAGKTATVGLWFHQGAPSGSALAGDDERSTLEVAGIVTISLGAAVLLAGAIAGSVGASKVGEIDDVCTTVGCKDPEFSDAVEEARVLEVVSYVGLSLGVAGIMGGIAMTVLGRDGSDQSAIVAPLPGGGFAGWRTTF